MQHFVNGQRSELRRFTEHCLFWLSALLMLTFFFGANKPSVWWALSDNLLYLPIHIIYFYTLAYWVMPQLLFKKKYLMFVAILLFCIISSALLTRLLDILIIDPRLFAVFKQHDPAFTWAKMEGSFAQRLFNIQYFANAIKGVNLIIWTALTIKFFKMWHERREAALQAELNFLKGQIHPHFLFNTLNNLYSLSLTKSDKSPGIVMGLSEILKYMLYETKTPTIPLKRDVEVLESYIALEKVRYEERLEVNFKASPLLYDYEVAPLLLLPLVENAFKHGTSEKVGEVWINIDLTIKNDVMKFKVSNSKPDNSPGDIIRHKGNIGLPNVKKRLDLLYPNAHDLKIFDEEEMFAIILEIQLEKHI